MLAKLSTMQPNEYDQGLNQPLQPGQNSSHSPQHHHSSSHSQSQSNLDMPYQLPVQVPQTLHTLPPYNPLYGQPLQPSQAPGQGQNQQQWLPQWQSYGQPYSRVSFSGPATTNPQSQYRFDSYDDHSSSMQGIPVPGSQSSSASGPSQPKSPMDNYDYSKQRPSGVHPSPHSTVYSFVPLPGAQQQKRPRRKYEDIERIYNCSYPNCTKAYGTLNHLNAHITMQGHGEKRTPAEFKETRRLWKLKKKEQDAVAVSHQSHSPQQSQSQSQTQQGHPQSGSQLPLGHQPGVIGDSSNPYFSSHLPLYNSDSVRSFDSGYYKDA
jgi:transcription factor CON7